VDQPVHVSLWSEKGTVAGTLRPVLKKYEVPFQIVHGFSGATPVHNAANANLRRKQNTLILYVGDFDPSGMYMSEMDLPKRLARYSSADPGDKTIDLEEAHQALAEVRLDIQRIALTKADTIELGEAPRFPANAKKKDTRYSWFVANHGRWCWELDALAPNILRARVEEAILSILDLESWNRYVRVEELEREAMRQSCQAWGSILDLDSK
jgi:hypothetical protein